MSKGSEAVKEWRRRTKRKIVAGFRGYCCICRGVFEPPVYDLHHRKPAEKDFSWGQIMASPRAWDVMLAELMKCVLVCSNCHRRVHYVDCAIPDDAPAFSEPLAEIANWSRESTCPTCGISFKHIRPQTYCSRKCMKKRHRTLASGDASARERMRRLSVRGECPVCGMLFTKPNNEYCSWICYLIDKCWASPNPGRAVLEKEIATTPFAELGKKYGVDDRTVRNWAASFGLPTNRRGIYPR